MSLLKRITKNLFRRNKNSVRKLEIDCFGSICEKKANHQNISQRYFERLKKIREDFVKATVTKTQLKYFNKCFDRPNLGFRKINKKNSHDFSFLDEDLFVVIFF